MADESRANNLLQAVDQGFLSHIQDLFRTSARKVRTRLVNRSGTDVPVRFGTAELSTLGLLQDRLMSQEGGAFGRCKMQPGDLNCMVVIQGPLLFRLVGIMLGEDPDGEPPLYRWRSLTSVDLRIASRICHDALQGLMEACPRNIDPFFSLEVMSANPRVPIPMARSTMMVEATLDFGPPEDPYGLMSVVLPANVAGVLWPKKEWRRERSGNFFQEGMSRVLPLEVDAVAELARTKVSLGSMRELTVGSIIDLGSLRDIRVLVGGRPALLAEGGERDGVRSIRVIKRLETSSETKRQ
jgi:flagellar motor switch protein FliM